MAGGRVGGNGGPIKRAAWVFVAACIAVAAFGDFAKDPGQVLPTLTAKSQRLEKSVHEWVAKVGLSEDGAPPKGVTVPKGSLLPKDAKTVKPSPKASPAK